MVCNFFAEGERGGGRRFFFFLLWGEGVVCFISEVRYVSLVDFVCLEEALFFV